MHCLFYTAIMVVKRQSSLMTYSKTVVGITMGIADNFTVVLAA